MKIAIIGSGISGLTCGYYLCREHDITVFEANNYIGGHTATVDVDTEEHTFAVDTGFIVFNDKTYPHFIRLIDELGVGKKPTQMSFSVSNRRSGLEYNGHTISTLFAQRQNLLRPEFYAFIFEILRFNRLAKQSFRTRLFEAEKQTLGDFLQQHHFSDYFSENYILPMGAAIWSSTIADMRSFPLAFFLRFFLNHGLLDIANRPQWYVIEGGSRSYIGPLVENFRDRIRLCTPVRSVERFPDYIEVTTDRGCEKYDEVIFACHSDQALRMIIQPTVAEQEILSSIGYQANQVTLHTDTTLLPETQKAWASWNYRIGEPDQSESERPVLTYNMNILQHLTGSQTFCVSLNSDERVDPAKILRQFSYDHPVFDSRAVAAQQRKSEISGMNRSWYCGAYWLNGFHEDGVVSALDVVRRLEALHEQISQGVA